ncbi:alpha-glucuronidase [Salipaludibacillus agaradhaerens]|uniref:Xylan alpha-1,2-glucuronidase n=1 Tax=Salipaludibacillus agaradhaerens TaxID=76935 RepID=A0A9Q4AYX3_SALAG|nr:alpha-glucuronidase family glycosyl hydrolase [Salipaludibacillus agaradhaerens]MCR6095090.1 alpha-glucuronidase [Salipaludibacillus agaradhaerens]MCR6115352.1 alpha-glucuronidase [Salipaludibacillus agaradhaerens]
MTQGQYHLTTNYPFENDQVTSYKAWLQYSKSEGKYAKTVTPFLKTISSSCDASPVLWSAIEELNQSITQMFDFSPFISFEVMSGKGVVLQLCSESETRLQDEGYMMYTEPNGQLIISGKTETGILYGTFHLLRLLQMGKPIDKLNIIENPANSLRLLNHWDNIDGSIERGYAGKSIFFENDQFSQNYGRLKDYARMLASIGVNGIAINNVNVHQLETKLITPEYLTGVEKIAAIFRAYGVKTFLSINFASPIELGGLKTADPLDEEVKRFWEHAIKTIYTHIPDFGGVVVKADSENRPGPFTYGRSQAEGANMLAEIVAPYGGLVIWRCFVYNCHQDWRDRTTDRAKAAYDHFMPLDGDFHENVVLQIKNGPMDFQVREPVSPLLGGLKETNQVIEFQITQEYLGQQIHLVYLVPQWKEVLEFETYAKGSGSTVKKIVSGELYDRKNNGAAAVVNVGDDYNWTGHTLAQSNLYGYGRLMWSPEMTAEDISNEWITCTFGADPLVLSTIKGMLLNSWTTYENYTSPLGVGWMVNPGHHYGPNVDGYEYQAWGTYHFADWKGLGVNRTMATGTGFSGQYYQKNAEKYESLTDCPEELLLFFHYVPYSYVLSSGKTVIQHIYDTHFAGVEQVEQYRQQWKQLQGRIDKKRFDDVATKLDIQFEHAKEWRDIVNTYFYRKSGIDDQHNRPIY